MLVDEGGDNGGEDHADRKRDEHEPCLSGAPAFGTLVDLAVLEEFCLEEGKG